MTRPLALSLLLPLLACGPNREGLARARPAGTTVKFDFFHRPLPEIPLPNDLATRYDADSATGRRINVSLEAPTAMERRVRGLVDTLDGWGVFQPISIPFTGPLDVLSLRRAHGQDDYAQEDDAVFLINIDPASPRYGRVQTLDIGQNNHPPVLEDLGGYWPGDPRGFTISLLYEEAEEDQNGNGILDPGEDTDLDGALDHPNYLPGHSPAREDLGGRADALMSFYEASTHTLIARPLEPLDERTRYAVVVTRRLLDMAGEPVGSPFEYVHHLAQTDALAPLPELLPPGVALEDVAFAFSYTTQTVQAEWPAVRDGLYGHGVQAELGRAFPPEVDELYRLRDPARFPQMANPFVVHGETVAPLIEQVQKQFRGLKDGSQVLGASLEALRYVDYFAVGRFRAPQLFPEADADGAPLPYDLRSWPADLDRRPAPVRSEDLYFTLVVPRKEISARGQGRPAPVVLLSHGYGGNRFDAVNLGAHFARRGLAVLAIDGPGHGLEINPFLEATVNGVFGNYGLEPFAAALLKDRAEDLNADTQRDPGADFWTAYLFHTRDVVRQFALDYMSLVRLVRSFDGQRRWRFDVNGDGQPELAGDFDGDGVVDIGADAPIVMSGGSLGGMMSVLMGSLEPEISAVAPIAAGGTLGSIGTRSTVKGVRVALILRSMGPIYLAERDGESGRVTVSTLVPDLAKDGSVLSLARLDGLAPGDVLVAENLVNGEVRCGLIDAAGQARVGLPSDLGDATRLSFFAGDEVQGGDQCTVTPGATPKAEVSRFGEALSFQGRKYAAGAPLVALAEGLGVRRGHPELRRFQGIAQLVLDRADPAVYARHLAREPLRYPATGQETGAHMLLVTTIGDSSVPADSGMAIARAAGLLPFREVDPRYGKPANQVLLDWHVAESSDTYARYRARDGRPIHPDVEGFDQGTALWSPDTTKLDPPLRLGFDRPDLLGGRSAAIFPLTAPQGDHGFDEPYRWLDRARDACLATCTSTASCDCPRGQGYDVGNFLLNMITRFLVSNGQVLSAEPCMSNDTCPDAQPAPASRAPEVLR